MRYITIVFVTLITFYGYSQEITILHGKIVVDALQPEAIHILNQTQNLGVISNRDGFFAIRAKQGDTIVVSSIQYALKRYVVQQKDLHTDDFEIRLEMAVNELEEVRISQYTLSGKLENDILNIPTHTENLPFWNAAELKRMGVGTFDDAQSPVQNLVLNDEMSATQVDFMAIGKIIGGLFKNGNKIKIKETPITITDLYSQEFFIEGLRIPEEEYYNFLDYLNEQPGIMLALQSPDKLKTLEYILEKSQAYRSKYGID
ncbi:peptidase associated/transthyretin-like domain-containing protein [Aquimarina mytili]|uniref:Carboxypeptidase-like regulatory domain-containing protein n=1 Tax=Aquimarina mytili TaxID=874423 RepID=A0A936ZSD2_9FLAO|nr:hypothetical protein [Aquimarina mytili]MBL0683808.1 hypothetical protein [Aquimarina mytili]